MDKLVPKVFSFSKLSVLLKGQPIKVMLKGLLNEELVITGKKFKF